MEERKQFTFYLSFFHAISRIRNKAARCDAYDAICAYALTGAVPDLDTLPDAAAIAFELSRPNLDSSIRKAKNGKAGGSAKQTGSKREANAKQEHPESEKEKDSPMFQLLLYMSASVRDTGRASVFDAVSESRGSWSARVRRTLFSASSVSFCRSRSDGLYMQARST